MFFFLFFTCAFSHIINPFKEPPPKQTYLSKELKVLFFSDDSTCKNDVPESVSIVHYGVCYNGLIYTDLGEKVNVTFYNDDSCQRLFVELNAPKNTCYSTGKNSFIYSDVQTLKTVQQNSASFYCNILRILLFMITFYVLI